MTINPNSKTIARIVAARNGDFICDTCKRKAKCKDFTGTGANKGYHHIYCDRYQEGGLNAET